jgi:hypothetical protein
MAVHAPKGSFAKVRQAQYLTTDARARFLRATECLAARTAAPN